MNLGYQMLNEAQELCAISITTRYEHLPEQVKDRAIRRLLACRETAADAIMGAGHMHVETVRKAFLDLPTTYIGMILVFIEHRRDVGDTDDEINDLLCCESVTPRSFFETNGTTPCIAIENSPFGFYSCAWQHCRNYCSIILERQFDEALPDFICARDSGYMTWVMKL